MARVELEKTRKAVVWEIENIVRVYMPSLCNFDVMAATYMIKVASEQDVCPETAREVFNLMKPEYANYIYDKSKIDVAWRSLKVLVGKYDIAVLDDVLRYEFALDGRRESEDTPESLIKLAEGFLAIDENDNVLNVVSNSGLLLATLHQDYPNNKLFGMDIDQKHIFISKIRAEVFPEGTMNFIEQDVLSADNSNYNFDKIISTHPFGFRTRSLSNRYGDIEARYPFIKSGTAADWIYIASAMDMLADDGKLVAFVSAGCLFTNQDKEARKHFVEKGLLEAVVSLPPRMYSSTSINMVMLVFSKGNEKVHFISAENNYQRGRRQNEFAEEDIKAILKASKQDTEISVTVNIEQLAKEDYTLNPERYINSVEENIENGQPLGSLVTVNRSATIVANDLDALAVIDDTEVDTFYLRLSEIQDNVIVKNLPKIKEIDKKYEKLLLQKNDIILSRNGSPFKLALFDREDDVKVLPVGNLYVLRADKEKINPVYLKAYLESQQGIGSLKSMLTGVAMQVISTERLKKLIVPVPSREEQEEIANKYMAIMDEMEVLNLKMAAAKNRLAHVCDNQKVGG